MDRDKLLDTLPQGISVVVAVYNSESSLKELLAELTCVLEPIGQPYEIILVNDGSRDKSWLVVSESAQTRTSIVGINLMRNFGQHNALLCGIRAARYSKVVTLDDDLQNPPAEIPRLLEKFAEGYDVVYGAPVRQRHGFWRDCASVTTKLTLQGTM